MAKDTFFQKKATINAGGRLIDLSNPKVMGEHVSSPVLRWLGWTTLVVMTAAAVVMLIA